jgi:hypothetical protein
VLICRGEIVSDLFHRWQMVDEAIEIKTSIVGLARQLIDDSLGMAVEYVIQPDSSCLSDPSHVTPL